MTRDKDGYRHYTIRHMVVGETTDGPAEALTTFGLPIPGNSWILDGEFDPWCTCTLDAKVTPHGAKEGSPSRFWIIEQEFTNKPETHSAQKGYERPKNDQQDNPLLEPQKISGGGVKYQEEAVYDRFGRPIVNSAYEPIRGPKVEFDANRHSVKIEQNVPLLEIEACTLALDTVNLLPMWGVGRRRVKLSHFSWEVKYYQRVNKYYTRHFEFEINNGTWDRYIIDEGTRCLRGHWDKGTGLWVLDPVAGLPPDPFNLTHFDFYQDRKGNMGRVFLNGAGLPAGIMIGASDVYMSVDPLNNRALTASTFWVPVVGDPTRIAAWEERKSYIRGEMVTRESGGVSPQAYIARVPLFGALRDDNFNAIFGSVFNPDPAGEDGPEGWYHIGKVGEQTNKGRWSASTTYGTGDYVEGFTSAKFAPGRVFVSKYNETDFVGALNIPAVL